MCSVFIKLMTIHLVVYVCTLAETGKGKVDLEPVVKTILSNIKEENITINGQ